MTIISTWDNRFLATKNPYKSRGISQVNPADLLRVSGVSLDR